MESLLYHIDGKRQEKERYIPNPAIHSAHSFTFLFLSVCIRHER